MRTETIPSQRIAWWTVSQLTLLYVFSCVDRTMLALVIGPIKAEFSVSDAQLGLLFGPAFAIFYAAVGIPMARVADRGNRYLLIMLSVFVWGLCTLGTGLAGSFFMLVMLRIGLAIAEASLTPAAHSMIGDMFVPARRITAASVYTAVGQAGGAASAILGGAVLLFGAQLAQSGSIPASSEWRMAFIGPGVVTVLLGFVFALTVREPKRTGGESRVVSLRDVVAMILEKPRLYVAILVSVGLTQLVVNAFYAWTPELLFREYGLPRVEAAFGFGLANVVGLVGGTLLTPVVSQALVRAGRADGALLVSIGTLLAGGLAAIVATLAASPVMFLIAYAFVSACLVGSTNNLVIAQQITAPGRMRGTMVALMIMSITILGQGLGPLLVPLLVDAFRFTGGGLSGGLLFATAAAVLPSLGLLLLSLKPYRATAGASWSQATTA